MQIANFLTLLLHFYLGYWFFKNTNNYLGKASAYTYLLFYVTTTTLMLFVINLPDDGEGAAAVGIGILLLPILAFIALLYIIGAIVTFIIILKRFRK